MTFLDKFSRRLGVLEYLGTWDASGAPPAIARRGGYYVVSIAGSTSLDGEADWSPGDWAVYSGSSWQKIDSTDQVSSVAGKQGAVTLVAADITDLSSAVVTSMDGVTGVVENDSPSLPTVVTDDFIFQSAETGELGLTGWSFTTGGVANSAPEVGHPGIVLRQSGATQNQVASFYPGSAGTVGILRFEQFDRMTWIVAPATAGADFDLRIGLLTDITSITPTNGVYVERLAADASYFGVSRSAGVQTRSAALGAIAANIWQKFVITRISPTSVSFSVNDGAAVVLSTNVPAAASALTFGVQIRPTTNTARNIKIDFFSMKLLPIAR